MSDRTLIYADGACSGNPGPGGWGAVVVQNGQTHELAGGFRRTTNNRMEIMACVMGLEAVHPDQPVTVISDSRYVVDMLNGGHALRWKKNAWMRDRKHAALNPDLWDRLLLLCEGRNVQFQWVRGHRDCQENEQADQLAVNARTADNLPPDPGFETPPMFVGQSLFDGLA